MDITCTTLIGEIYDRKTSMLDVFALFNWNSGRYVSVNVSQIQGY